MGESIGGSPFGGIPTTTVQNNTLSIAVPRINVTRRGTWLWCPARLQRLSCISGFQIRPGPVPVHHMQLQFCKLPRNPTSCFAENSLPLQVCHSRYDGSDFEQPHQLRSGRQLPVGPGSAWEYVMLNVHYDGVTGPAAQRLDNTTVDIFLEECTSHGQYYDRALLQTYNFSVQARGRSSVVPSVSSMHRYRRDQGGGTFQIWGLEPHYHKHGTWSRVMVTSAAGHVKFALTMKTADHLYPVDDFPELEDGDLFNVTCVYGRAFTGVVPSGLDFASNEMCELFVHADRSEMHSSLGPAFDVVSSSKGGSVQSQDPLPGPVAVEKHGSRDAPPIRREQVAALCEKLKLAAGRHTADGRIGERPPRVRANADRSRRRPGYARVVRAARL